MNKNIDNSKFENKSYAKTNIQQDSKYQQAQISNENNDPQMQHLDELVNGEGTTRYGEFVTSYFAWVGMNRQKVRAEQLNNMTKDNKET